MKSLRMLCSSPAWALLLATSCKVLIILLCHQHVIDYGSDPARLCRGYGWDELVSSMRYGQYSMLAQTGLSDLYDMRSASYRPPIYPLVLYTATCLGGYSAFVLVSLHSVITSVVAYLGYLFVKSVQAGTGQGRNAILCMWSVFLFPMNFLKSGAIDEAPLMMVFLLAGLWLLWRHMANTNDIILLVLSGVMIGLSTMVRYTTLFVAAGLFVYILVLPVGRHRYKHAIMFLCAYTAVLIPWLGRNYSVYGKPLLCVGSGRLLLVTQSTDFIESFPREHVDTIERRYLRQFHESHGYLSRLSGPALDREFKRYAVSEIKRAPGKFLRATITKLKVFMPYRYYPLQAFLAKDVLYVVPYCLTLLAFFWAMVIRRCFGIEHIMLYITIVACAVPGLLYFMLSRHLYSIIILMIVFVFTARDACSSGGYANTSSIAPCTQ